MKKSFLEIIRIPDDIKVYTETSPFRFEEPGEENDTRADVKCVVENDLLNVYLNTNGDAVKYVRMRWNGDISDVQTLLGDASARILSDDVLWRSFLPHHKMVWYFHTNDGECLHSYGVKTGCNCMVYWYADPYGITVLLDTRNGSGGVVCDELLCAQIVSRKGVAGEDMYKAAHAFCKMMCDKPKLPSTPIYGYNDFYWSYSAAEEKVVLDGAKTLGELTRGFKHRPFMMIDDGWQIAHVRGKYNGGPWHLTSDNFGSMSETADKVHNFGCSAGIWVRPLLTLQHVPEEATFKSPYQSNGITLDPSHEYSRQKIYDDIKMISGWGYDMIKHDFTFLDMFGMTRIDMYGLLMTDNWPQHFYDRSKTNAQIVKELYQTIQDAAGDTLVMGCNTPNHLVAGIHAIQRSGGDTSGRHFEISRRYGLHSMMRLPQNNAFFKTDPDCAVFTEKVSKELGFNYLEMAAITGSATFASVKPGILDVAEQSRLQEIFAIADTIEYPDYATITDWTRTAAPSKFEYKGEKYDYNWYKEYQGVRHVVSWDK
ncbi:MAG: hypothetical protein IKT42_05700 [Clostridia bacterium]|nr:hypothetical protein [Clostridia bacterium]